MGTVVLGQLPYNGQFSDLFSVAKDNNKKVLLLFIVAWESSMEILRPIPIL